VRSWQPCVVCGLCLAGSLGGDARADVPAPAVSSLAGGAAPADVRIALSPDGHFGAFLVEGPFERGKVPDETQLSPRLGDPWRLVAADGGIIDLAEALDAQGHDRFAYAAGVLHVEHGGRHVLLVGADDGAAVILDGKRIFGRDDARPQRDDDDLIPLDLDAGDHSVVLALHNHGGAWSFRARLLDAQLDPPQGAAWVLPGSSADDARALAARLPAVSLDRGLVADGYRPVLTVRYPQGAPRGVPLPVHARLSRSSTGGTPLFDVDAGAVPLNDRGVQPLTVALPHLGGDEVEDDDWTVHVDVAGRGFDLPFHPRRAVREAVARADRALRVMGDDSVEHLRDRLAAFVNKGDGDIEALTDDARELDELAATLEDKRDPWAGVTGAMRRAYRSPLDGKLDEFALYVPPGIEPGRKLPLIVALHGMNGRPLEMIMWLFGHDDPAHDGNWEDRHPRRDLEHLNAIVVAPDGYFNTMYRDLGEEDVMRVTDWVMAHYPIDESRVTITGPSMGGIGTAACALHHPDRFAGAEPLCGYHSYFVRGDVGNARLRPWERFIAEQRSNVMWAENGMYIPMYVVHGTKDLPEENSGVLIDRYNDLHYAMKDEHPELGHNVWQTTYEDLKGAQWLLDRRRPINPRAVRFKTARTRWADDAWVHVHEMESPDGWGEIITRIDKGNVIYASTHGLEDVVLDRNPERIDDGLPVSVHVDGVNLTFQAGEPLEMHKEGGTWRAGPAVHAGPYKHGAVAGPMRDVFHEPILFVWGASDPAQARANEETARGWAKVRWGVRADYPIMSDTEFLARGEPIANDRALFLVGNARSNRLVRELEPSFPIRIEGDDVVVGDKHFAPKDGAAGGDASQLGVAFIRPNPRRVDRYVVVVEGVGPLGTWRSLSLPDMLPDWIVFDEDVAQARGMLLLGAGTPRAGGMFTNDWALVPPEPIMARSGADR